MTASHKASEKRENPLINLAANVVLPVVILKQLSARGPVLALIVALLFPLSYGVWSYITSKKLNYISLLGLLNTLFTGGFALLKLEGIWFAVKEAAFPFIIGIFVFLSSFKTNPFLGLMLFDTGALHTDEIFARLEQNNQRPAFLKLLQRATFFFSLTFFMSAALNFILAYNIFEKIPDTLSEEAQTTMLNDQIANMTWMGYAVIFLPSILCFIGIMFFFFKTLQRLTGLTFEQALKS